MPAVVAVFQSRPDLSGRSAGRCGGQSDYGTGWSLGCPADGHQDCAVGGFVPITGMHRLQCVAGYGSCFDYRRRRSGAGRHVTGLSLGGVQSGRISPDCIRRSLGGSRTRDTGDRGERQRSGTQWLRHGGGKGNSGAPTRNHRRRLWADYGGAECDHGCCWFLRRCTV